MTHMSVMMCDFQPDHAKSKSVSEEKEEENKKGKKDTIQKNWSLLTSLLFPEAVDEDKDVKRVRFLDFGSADVTSCQSAISKLQAESRGRRFSHFACQLQIFRSTPGLGDSHSAPKHSKSSRPFNGHAYQPQPSELQEGRQPLERAE